MDAASRTLTGQYLPRWEAVELDGLLGGEVVWVAVGCCDRSELDLAEGLVAGDMAARQLAADTPVFVDGAQADPTQTARLADRLINSGLTRVFVLLP